MELSPETDAGGGFRLRPFSLPAGERTFGFLAGWIARLLRIGGWTLGGEDPSEIRARVEDLYAFAPQRRTLGVLVVRFPQRCGPLWGAGMEMARGVDISITRRTLTTSTSRTGR